jgi:hypothetical protein
MSTVVPGWPVAFRGSLAVAAGLSSWSRLRGSRFHRLFLGGGQRTHPGLTVHRDRIAPGETTRVDDIRCTTPLRTAYDLGRQDDLVEAVVAVDRLANRHRFPPDLLLHFTAHYRGGPGTTRLCATLAHTNPYAGSPMESRLRMIIVQAGLPPPRVQWVVQDVDARTAV